MPRAGSNRDTYISEKGMDEFRKSLGLSPIVKAKVKCLGCSKEFISQDVKKNRMCGQCKNSDRGRGIHESYHSTLNSGKFSMDMLSHIPVS